MKQLNKLLLLFCLSICLMGQQSMCTPRIDAVITDPGVPGGPVTVIGSRFQDGQGTNRLLYDGEPLSVTSWSSSRIEAMLPHAKEDGVYDVQVIADGRASNLAGHALCGSCGCTLPAYEPPTWNNDNAVRQKNNCYNYGNDEITMTFAQPGRACGVPYASTTCPAVRAAAVCDGLVSLDPGTEFCPEGMHRVYLVVSRDLLRDYHWYRQDEDGGWSHKPGNGDVTDLDNSDNAIVDPESADVGPYEERCGYMCACGDYAYIW